VITMINELERLSSFLYGAYLVSDSASACEAFKEARDQVSEMIKDYHLSKMEIQGE